eukprot:12421301-Alexandrium_andersonii.AAC.1
MVLGQQRSRPTEAQQHDQMQAVPRSCFLSDELGAGAGPRGVPERWQRSRAGKGCVSCTG